MATPTAILAITDEEGSVTRHPVFNSTLSKFERRYKRTYTEGSSIDASTLGYYLVHDQKWPPSDDALDDWYDTIRSVSAEEVEPNGSGPTDGPPTQS